MPVGFKHSWLSTKLLFAREASSAMATRSECEREAREAAANLVLSTVLPHFVRMGTRVLETLGKMREILSYDSIGCNPATELEHRLTEWLERRAAAPDTPPREVSVSAPAHLPEREEEGERAAGEAGAGGNHFLAAKGRRAARGGFYGTRPLPSSTAATTFWFPVSSATQARVCPKQNCWSAFTGWGRQVPPSSARRPPRRASTRKRETCGSSSTSPP